MYSALSSALAHPPGGIVTVVLVAAVIILGAILKRGFRRTRATSSSWKSYIGGQGLLLFFFLVLGFALAWLSLYAGPNPHPGRVTQGKLVAYHVDPSKGIFVEEQDVRNCPHITVFAQTAAPQDGSATIVVYGESSKVARHEIGRMDMVAGVWSRWEIQNSSDRLTLNIATGAGAQPATMVDVLVFLSSE